MLSQRSRCGAMKCQEDLEKTCISKWQQVAFASHAHLKREDHKHEHILPAKAMMGNQAGGENGPPIMMFQVKISEKVSQICFL